MKDYYQNLISHKFNKLLKKYSLTAVELSQKTNIDKAKISRVVNKKGMFTIPELHNIASFFKVDMNYFFATEDDLPSNIIPVVDITKDKQERQIYQITYESSNKNVILGVYVNESQATSLIPKSVILIINMALKKHKIENKPVVFLYQKRLHLGLIQEDQILNVATAKYHSSSKIDILGFLEQQVIEIPKQTYADKSILEAFISQIRYLDLKHDYLYRLLSA
ncbi:MAG: helix-turn-helix transcriptional regulator [Lentisphaerae bacterium]|nr:helix-turn-helix transcriptional regulator [Lentisphaerota bacterium]MCP4101051.1 helix-turn-helix transcriptional regulator [Lentisphaerota bacterium]